MFKADFVAKALKTRSRGSREFKRIWTDSRSLLPGDLFVAVKGQNFDGHTYVLEASQKGAKGAIVSHTDFDGVENLPKGFSLFVVDDTTHALRQIAKAHRRRLKTKIFAVAGSNGKTTTKEWLAFLLEHTVGKERVFKTQKSNNSILGIALSLLQIRKHDFAVIEIGIDEPGWMDKHLEVVAPDAGVITSIGEEHLAHLVSLDIVAQEELKLLHELRKSKGAFAANQDCDWVAQAPKPPQTLRYALDAEADIEGLYEKPNTLHCFGLTFTNPLAGKHNAQNLLAALTGLRLLLPDLSHDQLKILAMSTALFRGEAHRGVLLSFDPGIRVLDDCYNANPDSMDLAIQSFLEISEGCHQKLVLGDMLDLGESSARAHQRILNVALVSGVDEILLFGPQFGAAWSEAQKLLPPEQRRQVVSFVDIDHLIHHLRSTMRSGDTYLLKGSRGMALERVLKIFER